MFRVSFIAPSQTIWDLLLVSFSSQWVEQLSSVSFYPFTVSLTSLLSPFLPFNQKLLALKRLKRKNSPRPWKHFGRLSLNMKNTNRSSAGSSVAARLALLLLSWALIRKHRRTSAGNVHFLIPPPCQDVARVAMVRTLFNWQHHVSAFSYFTSQLVRPQGSVHGRFPLPASMR